MFLLAAILLCFASGFLLVRLGWSTKNAPITAEILHGSLAVGFGVGIFSVVFFLARVSGARHLLLFDVGVFAALVVAYFLLRSRTVVSFTTTRPFTNIPQWLQRLVRLAFVLAVAAALYSAITRVLAYPHGDGWDAFSIWNLRARFLFLIGRDWRDTFSSLIPGSHPDYPLLLPAGIAHFWTVIGHDDPRVPAAIAFLFTFATVSLLFSTVHALRGPSAAMLASITLLATPSFIEQGTAQYADIPLSFFFLATIALLCLSEAASGNRSALTCLAGLAAGFSAWTKNEGLLFLAAVVASRIFFSVSPRLPASDPQLSSAQWRFHASFLTGAVPILLALFYFKHNIAGPGDLFSGGSSTLHKLVEPARYWAVLQWFVKDFFRFGRWLLIPGTVLLAGLGCGLKSNASQHSNAIRICTLALLLTLAGYAAIYLITPRDLYWHLRFSSGRLFLQLWPSAIFLFFSRR